MLFSASCHMVKSCGNEGSMSSEQITNIIDESYFRSKLLYVPYLKTMGQHLCSLLVISFKYDIKAATEFLINLSKRSN